MTSKLMSDKKKLPCHLQRLVVDIFCCKYFTLKFNILFITSRHYISSLHLFLQIKSQHTGQYCCRLKNSAGTAESTADLVVKRKQLSPVFLKRLQSISENAGNRVIVEVEVGGTPSPTVVWFKDGVPIVNTPGHLKIHEN